MSNKFSSTSLISSKTISFYLKPITLTEALRHIKQLNPAKSTGPEEIPLKFIAMGAEIIAPVLVHLYRPKECIKTGVYPNILKIAQVVPLHKSGLKTQCNNYRPTSLFSPFSKDFEKCLHEQLYIYFEKFKLLTKHIGFKQNCSTSNAVRQL